MTETSKHKRDFSIVPTEAVWKNLKSLTGCSHLTYPEDLNVFELNKTELAPMTVERIP